MQIPSIETVTAIVARHCDKLDIMQTIDRVDVELIGQGEANLNLLVTVNRSHAFNLRMGLRDEESETTLQREFDILQLVPEGLAPHAYVLDLSRADLNQPYILLQYLDGAVKSRWSIDDLHAHAHQLARLHQRKFAHHGAAGNLSNAAFDFRYRFAVALKYWQTHHAYLFDIPVVQRLIPPIYEFVSAHNHLFTSLRHFTLVHGDAHPLNILFKESHVAYIDWEWAAIGDPAQDVAMVGWDIATSWQMELTGVQLESYLNAYLAYEPDATLPQRRDLWMVYTMFLDQMYHRTQIAHDTTGRQANTVQQIETYLTNRFIAN